MTELIRSLVKIADGDTTASVDAFKAQMTVYGAQVLTLQELLEHADSFATWATGIGEDATTLQEQVRKLVTARVDLQDYLRQIQTDLQTATGEDVRERVRSLQTEHAELEKSVGSLRAELKQREAAYQKEVDALKAINAVLESGNLKAAAEMAKKLGAATENEARLKANLETRLADIQQTHAKERKELESRLATAEAAVNQLPILRAKIASNEVREKEMEDRLRAEIERQKMLFAQAKEAGRFLKTIAAAPPNRRPIMTADKARSGWPEDVHPSKIETLREAAKAAGTPLAAGKAWPATTPAKAEIISSVLNPTPPTEKRSSQYPSRRASVSLKDYEAVANEPTASPEKRKLAENDRLIQCLNECQDREILQPDRSGTPEASTFTDDELMQILRDDMPATTNDEKPRFPRLTLAGILAAHPEAEAAIWAYIGRKQNENLGGDEDSFEAAVRSLLRHLQSLSVPHAPVIIDKVPAEASQHTVPESESTEEEEAAMAALMPDAKTDFPRAQLPLFQSILIRYLDKIYPLTTRTPAATVASVKFAGDAKSNAFRYFLGNRNRLADMEETWEWKNEDLPHTTPAALIGWLGGTGFGMVVPYLLAYYRDRLAVGDDSKTALADLYYRMRLFAGWIQMKVKQKHRLQPGRRVTRSRG